MTNELESDIRYFKACIEYMPKGEPIASYMIHKGICERAIQALEKQMTKSWIRNEYFDGECTWECPCCKEEYVFIEGGVLENGYSYCPNCGQALKWE